MPLFQCREQSSTRLSPPFGRPRASSGPVRFALDHPCPSAFPPPSHPSLSRSSPRSPRARSIRLGPAPCTPCSSSEPHRHPTRPFRQPINAPRFTHNRLCLPSNCHCFSPLFDRVSVVRLRHLANALCVPHNGLCRPAFSLRAPHNGNRDPYNGLRISHIGHFIRATPLRDPANANRIVTIALRITAIRHRYPVNADRSPAKAVRIRTICHCFCTRPPPTRVDLPQRSMSRRWRPAGGMRRQLRGTGFGFIPCTSDQGRGLRWRGGHVLPGEQVTLSPSPRTKPVGPMHIGPSRRKCAGRACGSCNSRSISGRRLSTAEWHLPREGHRK